MSDCVFVRVCVCVGAAFFISFSILVGPSLCLSVFLSFCRSVVLSLLSFCLSFSCSLFVRVPVYLRVCFLVCLFGRFMVCCCAVLCCVVLFGCEDVRVCQNFVASLCYACLCVCLSVCPSVSCLLVCWFVSLFVWLFGGLCACFFFRSCLRLFFGCLLVCVSVFFVFSCGCLLIGSLLCVIV